MHTGDVPLVELLYPCTGDVRTSSGVTVCIQGMYLWWSYCPMHRGCTSGGVTVPCTGDVPLVELLSHAYRGCTSSGVTVPCTGEWSYCPTVPLVEILSHAQGMYVPLVELLSLCTGDVRTSSGVTVQCIQGMYLWWSYCPMHRGCTSGGVTVPCTGDVPLVELLSHAQGMYLWWSYCPMHRGCTSGGVTVPCTGGVPLVELLSHAQGVYLWWSVCTLHLLAY